MLSPREESQGPQGNSKKSAKFTSFHFAPSEVSSGSQSPFGLNSPPKEDTLDNDSYSLNSSINSQHDSLIFERLVQDPLTSGQPVSHSLPRHVSCDTFIPSSLDTTTHLMNNPESELDHEAIELGFNSRRSSLANLEAAFNGSSSNSRRSSSTNLNNSSGFYKRGSYSQASLSRTSSNLTQQLQQTVSQTSQTSTPSQQPQQPQQQNKHNTPPLSSHSSSSSLRASGINGFQTLPPLKLSRSGSSISGPRAVALSNSQSPSMRNKSFCSYADVIAQDDIEMKSPIRRPSISASLSNSFSMARSNSASNPRSPATTSYRNRQFSNNNNTNKNDESDSQQVFSTSIDNNIKSSSLLRKNSDSTNNLRHNAYSIRVHSSNSQNDDDDDENAIDV